MVNAHLPFEKTVADAMRISRSFSTIGKTRLCGIRPFRRKNGVRIGTRIAATMFWYCRGNYIGIAPLSAQLAKMVKGQYRRKAAACFVKPSLHVIARTGSWPNARRCVLFQCAFLLSCGSFMRRNAAFAADGVRDNDGNDGFNNIARRRRDYVFTIFELWDMAQVRYLSGRPAPMQVAPFFASTIALDLTLAPCKRFAHLRRRWFFGGYDFLPSAMHNRIRRLRQKQIAGCACFKCQTAPAIRRQQYAQTRRLCQNAFGFR